MSKKTPGEIKTKKDQDKHKRLYKMYGISLLRWWELSQYGCEICGRVDGRLCMDHIHVAGFSKMSPEEKEPYLRGALCFMCNTALKSFEKTKDGERNRAQLEGTVRYFQKYKLKGEI